ncbi:unnamed protein product [Penicillium bialowiezense]
MAWYSILPPELTHLESWAASIFFFLGLVTIGPWAFLVLLDATIWIYRMILWELPWVGGRARGRQRPRAPSLHERPGGQRRALGLRGVETDSGGSEGDDQDDTSDYNQTKGHIESRNVTSSARESPPHPSGGGILKRRSSGQL